MELPLFIKQVSQGLLLCIKVIPGSKKTLCDGLINLPDNHSGFKVALKIRLKAFAVEGKANDCLIQFLAENLFLSKADIIIQTGEHSRQKNILLKELPLKKFLSSPLMINKSVTAK